MRQPLLSKSLFASSTMSESAAGQASIVSVASQQCIVVLVVLKIVVFNDTLVKSCFYVPRRNTALAPYAGGARRTVVTCEREFNRKRTL